MAGTLTLCAIAESPSDYEGKTHPREVLQQAYHAPVLLLILFALLIRKDLCALPRELLHEVLLVRPL